MHPLAEGGGELMQLAKTREKRDQRKGSAGDTGKKR